MSFRALTATLRGRQIIHDAVNFADPLSRPDHYKIALPLREYP